MRQPEQNLNSNEFATPLHPPPSGPSQSKPAKSRLRPVQESKSGLTISRPMQMPQWPLNNNASPSGPNKLDSQKPPKSQQTPQRPPRPSQSRIPSILDQSRPQQPTPVFTSRPTIPDTQDKNDNGLQNNLASVSGSSARQTTSSVGTIPDFPTPAPGNSLAPPRKSAILGPPPSSRRGASSFYSNASFVSPIPEESPRSRSHGSYASSAAMPETWPAESPQIGSPGYGDAFYDESMTERSRESGYDDFGDESQLVRSASLGKKGRPALITTKGSSSSSSSNIRHGPVPMPVVSDNEAYMSTATSSSETVPTLQKPRASYINTASRESLSTDAILMAYASTGSSDSRDPIQLGDIPHHQSRLSAMRRPPRLDIDAVRAAEARGSLTSLPDLIRRATRLASMIDKGKRPASRLDALDAFSGEKGKSCFCIL
jgi:hypothetical protein